MSIPVLGVTLCIIVISFLSAGNSIFGLDTANLNSTVKTHEYTLIAEDTTIEISSGYPCRCLDL